MHSRAAVALAALGAVFSAPAAVPDIAAKPGTRAGAPALEPGTTAPAAKPGTAPVPDTAAKPGTAPPAAPAAPVDALERRREAVAKEILGIGATLRRAIEVGDVEALLTRVPAGGLRCGERVVPRSRVERDLRAPSSWLHEVFFGSGADAGSPRRPRSLRAFFQQVPDTAMVVGFRPLGGARALGRPCLDYRAEGVATPGAPLCFELRDGRWWFVDSLYPCR